MGPRPSPRHSIERVNNDGDYCAENCVWALPMEQGRNSRWNKTITYNGVTLHLREWERRLGFRYGLLSERLTYGWPIERVMTEPPRHWS